MFQREVLPFFSGSCRDFILDIKSQSTNHLSAVIDIKDACFIKMSSFLIYVKNAPFYDQKGKVKGFIYYFMFYSANVYDFKYF